MRSVRLLIEDRFRVGSVGILSNALDLTGLDFQHEDVVISVGMARCCRSGENGLDQTSSFAMPFTKPFDRQAFWKKSENASKELNDFLSSLVRASAECGVARDDPNDVIGESCERGSRIATEKIPQIRCATEG